MQNTIKQAVSFAGVGLHSGAHATVTVMPASAETGIWFRRVDVTDRDPLVPARWDAVEPSPLCTRIVNTSGVSVSTVEHLMAALAGTGIHNAIIEIDGPEVPILDGSSAPFVTALVARGVRRLAAPLNAIEILRPCEVTLGDATARLEPSETLEVRFEIDFEDAAIGHQERELRMANGAFVHELCDARTFCRLADVTQMRANGLALGGKAGENAVVFNGSDIICPGGLRHSDEPVRHKMLDALGDLALARMPILGRYTGIRAGHAVTNALLRQVMARPNLYRVVEVDDELAARLPGSGVSYFDVAGLIRAA